MNPSKDTVVPVKFVRTELENRELTKFIEEMRTVIWKKQDKVFTCLCSSYELNINGDRDAKQVNLILSLDIPTNKEGIIAIEELDKSDVELLPTREAEYRIKLPCVELVGSRFFQDDQGVAKVEVLISGSSVDLIDLETQPEPPVKVPAPVQTPCDCETTVGDGVSG